MITLNGLETEFVDDRAFNSADVVSIDNIIIKNRFGWAGANDGDDVLRALKTVHESAKLLNDSTGCVAYEMFSCVLRLYENFFRVTIPQEYKEIMLDMTTLDFTSMINYLTHRIIDAA